jgi:hypothetical protein
LIDAKGNVVDYGAVAVSLENMIDFNGKHTARTFPKSSIIIAYGSGLLSITQTYVTLT